MNPAIRKLHRVASPWIFGLLFISLTTGVIYRIGRTWFGMGKPTGDFILQIHSGDWLGDIGSAIFILLVGGGLLALLLTGLILLIKSRSKQSTRQFHRILGAILLLPLTVSALTGILFKFGEDYFSKGTLSLIMSLHQGSWLGKTGRPFYILFIGIGLLVLGLAGLGLMKRFRRKAPTIAESH